MGHRNAVALIRLRRQGDSINEAGRVPVCLANRTPGEVNMRMSKWGAVAILLGIAAPCSGAGIWNMPTTGRQYLGVGNGAGYHSPLVVGRPWRGGAASPGVHRVPATLVHNGPLSGGMFSPSEIFPSSDSDAGPPLVFRTDVAPSQTRPFVSRYGGFAPPPLLPPVAEEIYIEPSFPAAP